MNTCETCKHFLFFEETGNGYCKKLGASEAHPNPPGIGVVIPRTILFRCPPDFGCTLHEPKEEQN